MLELVGDRADAKGDLILMRSDNKPAIYCISPCGGTPDKRAWILMGMLGCLDIKRGWKHAAKTNARRTEHTSRWYLPLASCDPDGSGQRAREL